MTTTERDRRRLRAYEYFRPWLRARAKEQSQRRIATLSGIDHSTICRLVNGDREPGLATVRAIIEALIP
jgi:predicted transcriptional regulator